MALPDVVIIGAGVVGAACAFYAARAGLSVTVVDRGPIAGGTTGLGQGGVMTCDKPPGPALDLAVASLRRWEELGAELGHARLGLTRPGGLAVATNAAEWAVLAALADRQRATGVDAEPVPADRLRDLEPLLSPELVAGVRYPADLLVDPVRATAHLLRSSGAEVRCGIDVRRIDLARGERVAGVRTAAGERIGCGAVVNAAGVWAGEVSAMVGTPLPVTARQGLVLVTEALGAARAERRVPSPNRSTRARAAVAGASQSPRTATPGGWARPIRHTVYAPAPLPVAAPGAAPATDPSEQPAASGSAAATGTEAEPRPGQSGGETGTGSEPRPGRSGRGTGTGFEPRAGRSGRGSVVVTGGRAGAVLIGTDLDRVGVDRTWPVPVLRSLAARAVAVFPALGDVFVLRANRGFRPGTPDRLPIIGPDMWVAGLYHACGHSGWGVGLAPATGALAARLLMSEPVDPDPFVFYPERFG